MKENLFFDLFDYNHQMNAKLIESFENHLSSVPQKALFLFSHIQNAHHIWNARINGIKPLHEVFQEHQIEILKELNEENYRTSMEILKNKNPEEIIHYTNTKGQSFSNTIQDILFHVINHSTYHRAQIATLFRQHNLEPIPTDYISFKRK